MSRPDWLPPDGRTPEQWVAETPKVRRERQQLERWKAERIRDHRHMLAVLRGEPDTTEDDPAEPTARVKRPLTGTPWS